MNTLQKNLHKINQILKKGRFSIIKDGLLKKILDMQKQGEKVDTNDVIKIEMGTADLDKMIKKYNLF